MRPSSAPILRRSARGSGNPVTLSRSRRRQRDSPTTRRPARRQTSGALDGRIGSLLRPQIHRLQRTHEGRDRLHRNAGVERRTVCHAALGAAGVVASAVKSGGDNSWRSFADVLGRVEEISSCTCEPRRRAIQSRDRSRPLSSPEYSSAAWANRPSSLRSIGVRAQSGGKRAPPTSKIPPRVFPLFCILRLKGIIFFFAALSAVRTGDSSERA